MHSEHYTNHLSSVAKDVVEKLHRIAEVARLRIGRRSTDPLGGMAAINTLTEIKAVEKLSSIDQEARENLLRLTEEPAIARIVVKSGVGLETYYICRSSPNPDPELPNLASYKSPFGRAAALSIGDMLTLPKGKVELVERERLRPVFKKGAWDSANTIAEAAWFGPITIESLQVLLQGTSVSAESEDLLEALLQAGLQSQQIYEGIRRSVIASMQLRDQPILDKYQDEIFRLSLNSRLMIIGPPGTGKTTTLIRRLGLKLDAAFHDEEEKAIVERQGSQSQIKHSDSWIMFTPTELLKHYLKEAFAREGVPASNERIKTWEDFRRDFGRSEGILKTSTGNGVYVLKQAVNTLQRQTMEHLIEHYVDYNRWQLQDWLAELRQQARTLGDTALPDVEVHVLGLDKVLSDSRSSVTEILHRLTSKSAKVRTLIDELEKEVTSSLKASINARLQKERGFLDALTKQLVLLRERGALSSDEETEDDEEVALPRAVTAQEAVSAYIRAVRAKARADYLRRSLSLQSLNGQLLEWIGDLGFVKEELQELGALVVAQTALRAIFANPVDRYLKGIIKRYAKFRRVRQREARWYLDSAFDVKDLHPLEVDCIALCFLSAVREFQINLTVRQRPLWPGLQSFVSLYKNQIAVDEATDFSPVQLACMAKLSHPAFNSFFACGDYHQRLTEWGTKSEAELKWVCEDITIKKIKVVYRQSRQLCLFAKALLEAKGSPPQEYTLPEHVDSEGVLPVLLESAENLDAEVQWLASRICEIEEFIGTLPSIAVFVNSEAELTEVATALRETLVNSNIHVEACPDGKADGQDSAVRVFNVQHIKGLEFEAVFFWGVDSLAQLHPTLVDKYLYVGITRAASYLGLICHDRLPSDLQSLRRYLRSSWLAGEEELQSEAKV